MRTPTGTRFETTEPAGTKGLEQRVHLDSAKQPKTRVRGQKAKNVLGASVKHHKETSNTGLEIAWHIDQIITVIEGKLDNLAGKGSADEQERKNGNGTNHLVEKSKRDKEDCSNTNLLSKALSESDPRTERMAVRRFQEAPNLTLRNSPTRPEKSTEKDLRV
jgi:hypothetical protein